MEEQEIILEVENDNEQEIIILEEEIKEIYPELEDLEVTPTKEKQIFKSSKYGYDVVTVKAVKLQDKIITLNENGIYNIKADEEYLGLNNVEVTLDAIENLDTELAEQNTLLTEQEITIDTILETLKDKAGIGIELQEKSATPSTEEQSITADEGYTGLSKVTVAGDENLIADNIKKGINIFGIEGNLEILEAEEGTGIGKFTIDGVTSTYPQSLHPYIVEIPLINTSKVTSMASMFIKCSSLIKIPLINTSNVTNMNNMFSGCSALTEIPQINTSKVTDMTGMFSECSSLIKIPLINTSKVTNMNKMFIRCSALTEIPQIDTSKVTDMTDMFSYCQALTTLPQLNADKCNIIFRTLNECTGLTNFGGFKNLGLNYTRKTANYTDYKLNLNYSPLTHDSLMDVINNLYDLNLTYNVANGGTLYTQQLVLGATNLVKLSPEEIAIATNKRLDSFLERRKIRWIIKQH